MAVQRLAKSEGKGAPAATKESDLHPMILLPHDPDAERGVLSAFLLMPREVGNVCAEARVTEADFHLPAHATIYRHLFAMWAASDGIDTITLCDRMRKASELQEAGGPVYISEVSTALPTASMVRNHIEILQAKTLQRRLHATCSKFAAMAVEGGDGSAADMLLAAQTEIADLGAQKASQAKPFRTLLMETVDSIERGDDATADVLSGIQALDDVVRMRRGNVIVISGEAKSGKTALAGTILTNAAVFQSKRCVGFSLEMTDVEMVKRAISCAGRVNVAMMGRQPSEYEIQGVTRGVHALNDADIEIVSDTFDLGGIVARCRQMHAKRPLDLVVLDYLQLVEFSTGRKGETRQEIVAQISRTCKRVAGEFNCVLIALSQLNDDGKLRESRAIGQDANAVIQVEKEEDGGRSLRIVAQRSGTSGGSVPVRWLPQFTRFEDN